MEINAVISAQVLAQIASGLDPVSALKAVCGEDKVNDMIASLYEGLRAKV